VTQNQLLLIAAALFLTRQLSFTCHLTRPWEWKLTSRGCRRYICWPMDHDSLKLIEGCEHLLSLKLQLTLHVGRTNG